MTNERSLGSYARRNADRLEDLAFMASHGETPAGAARRLGISVDTLERWCHRHARELHHQLVANATQPGCIPAGHLTQRIR